MNPILSKIGLVAKLVFLHEVFAHRRGQILNLWAGLETDIDLSNRLAWQYSDRTISKVVPQSLRWKIELFERIHRDLIPDAEMRKKAGEIVRLIKDRQEDRHWLVHGMMVPWSTNEKGWRLKKTIFKPDGDCVWGERRITLQETDEMIHDLARVGKMLARYSALVALKFGKDFVHNKLR